MGSVSGVRFLSGDLLGQLLRQPVETLVQTSTLGGTGGLDVPLGGQDRSEGTPGQVRPEGVAVMNLPICSSWRAGSACRSAR